jgi:KDO2-lipid IV(A) lauroyltransferase
VNPLDRLHRSWQELGLAPDGKPRPDAPFGQGPLAARVLSEVMHGAALVASRLPASLTHAGGMLGGYAEWALRPEMRYLLAENLGHAVGLPPTHPLVRRLVREEFVNEARRSADLLWALARKDDFLDAAPVIGTEHVHEAFARGNGLILASLHLGGWEVATPIPSRHVPGPTSVITADDWLAWAIDRFREAAGLEVVYRTDSIIRIASLLRRNESVLVLGENAEDESVRRYPVRFLDSMAELPAGIPTLARLCGTPVAPFTVLPLGPRRWQVTIKSLVEPPARKSGREGEIRMLQELADIWSEEIRLNPELWAARFPMYWHELRDEQDVEPGAR